SSEARLEPRPEASTAMRAVRPNGNTAVGALWRCAVSACIAASRQPVGVELRQVPGETSGGHGCVGRDLEAGRDPRRDVGSSQLAVLQLPYAAGHGGGVLSRSQTGDGLCLPQAV